MSRQEATVHFIPVDQINILNPRSRHKANFQSIVENISRLGLKKPITVTRKPEAVEGKIYDLVCGQGRLEAFQSLGQEKIPALVIEATRQDCYLMSLVENIARRNPLPFELMREVGSLKSRGYSVVEIAQKIDLTPTYVRGICRLLENGEERLIASVESGKLPLSVAIEISNSDEAAIQRALCEAYEDQSLRGRKLTLVRRVIEQRKAKGKQLSQGVKNRSRVPSAEMLVRTYRQEADRQQLLVRKARITENQLLLVVSALKSLFHDENFVTLLRAEGFTSMPTYLADKLKQTPKADG